MDKRNEILDGLESSGNRRVLREVRHDGKFIIVDGERYMNFSTNDYLGIASGTELQREFLAQADFGAEFLMSNPSSRLITGNSRHYRMLEEALSAMYGDRAVTVASSGYMINTGVLPALTSKNDLILADKLVHASIIDGLRLCECRWMRFRHNDMDHLRRLVEKHRGSYENVWVVTESLFSMGGDLAPLKELVELKERYGLRLYLDEAHAFGARGADGAGYAAESGLSDQFDIIVATLGKAAASCGAFAVTDSLDRELLVNRMRTLIYSTAMAPVNLMWSAFIVPRLKDMTGLREKLAALAAELGDWNPCATHIVPLAAHGNENALKRAERLRSEGFWVTPIRYPTVPAGSERLRLSLSAALDIEDIEKFKKVCRRIG